MAEYAKVWWHRHAVPNLQRHTLANYASMLDVHIVPRFGEVPLRSLTPDLISQMRADKAAGVRDLRPYDLRHSFISLLIAQGATVVEVARQAGHSPTMALDTYAHLFDELGGGTNATADALIRAARAAKSVPGVSVLCPRPQGPDAPKSQNPLEV